MSSRTRAQGDVDRASADGWQPRRGLDGRAAQVWGCSVGEAGEVKGENFVGMVVVVVVWWLGWWWNGGGGAGDGKRRENDG